MASLTIKNVVVLKGFIKLVLNRCYDRFNLCKKMVEKKRCFGYIGSHGCERCEWTGFECPECGNMVGGEGDFCRGYCQYKYYKGCDEY